MDVCADLDHTDHDILGRIGWANLLADPDRSGRSINVSRIEHSGLCVGAVEGAQFLGRHHIWWRSDWHGDWDESYWAGHARLPAYVVATILHVWSRWTDVVFVFRKCQLNIISICFQLRRTVLDVLSRSGLASIHYRKREGVFAGRNGSIESVQGFAGNALVGHSAQCSHVCTHCGPDRS